MVVSAASFEAPIEISQLMPGQEQEWTNFLEQSSNATLFHQLDFLAYHPKDRFHFHHLLLRQRSKLIAVLPGGLVTTDKRPIFKSPLGASIGGLVLLPRTRAAQTLAMVEALQNHARAHNWGGIELTIPPPAYAPEFGDMVAFALFGRGFTLKHRWLCPMLAIDPEGQDRYRKLFRARNSEHVRAAHRNGMTIEKHGVEGLAAFLSVFNDTYARHGVVATHTPAEIHDILTRLPDRVWLVLATQNGTPVAGLMVLLLSKRIAYSFYICASTAHAELRGNLAAFASLLDWLGDRGCAWLDLGPGAWDGNFNSGTMFFKEGLGASGYNRDLWIWKPELTA